MAFRTPRGYAVNRPPYQEIQEGVRPQASTVPMEAWTGLPPVRVDELHHDPIVLDAGTIVGIASGGEASGKIFPAHAVGTGTIHLEFVSSDNTDWGLLDRGAVTGTALTNGPVLPLGVCYQPIYSFNLQQQWTNYERNVNVGFVTDYIIQIPAKTAQERAIQAGDPVMCSIIGIDGETDPADPTERPTYGRRAELIDTDRQIGTFRAFDNTAANQKYVVGRCLQTINFAEGTASTLLSADFANTSLTPEGQAEFKGLEKVQTVPGLNVAGSGTSGAPGWLTSAVSDATGYYKALTILVRL